MNKDDPKHAPANPRRRIIKMFGGSVDWERQEERKKYGGSYSRTGCIWPADNDNEGRRIWIGQGVPLPLEETPVHFIHDIKESWFNRMAAWWSRVNSRETMGREGVVINSTKTTTDEYLLSAYSKMSEDNFYDVEYKRVQEKLKSEGHKNECKYCGNCKD